MADEIGGRPSPLSLLARRTGSAQAHCPLILVGMYTGTRASAICGASLTQTPGRGYVDLERGVFYRRAIKETDKRQPPVRLPPRLLAHMRRWQRVGASQAAIVEY
jgi:hypothetical protein